MNRRRLDIRQGNKEDILSFYEEDRKVGVKNQFTVERQN